MPAVRLRFLHASCRSVLAATQIGLVAGTATLLASATGKTLEAQAPPNVTQRYRQDVLPVLQGNCMRCHGGMNRRSGYSMSTRAMALAGGNHGVAIVPGKPDSSLLLRLIGPGPYPNDLKPMPLKGKLTDAEIATLRRWVAEGAAMDR